MSLASAHPRRASIASRITGYVFLIIATCLIAFAWLIHAQLQWSVQQQADALGQSMLQQVRTPVESALSAKDTLSVAVLLRDLISNPYVSYAAFYNVENRIVAEAGQRPNSRQTNAGAYSLPVSSQNVLLGSLHLQIDLHALKKPLITSMQSMGVLAAALLLLSIFLSVHLGRSIALPLQSLSNWLVNPAPPAPHSQRTDEIGLLARQLNDYFITDTQTAQIPTLQDTQIETHIAVTEKHNTDSNTEQKYDSTVFYPHLTDELPAATAEQEKQPLEAHSAILAVGFGSMEQLRQLPSERLNELMKKYRNAVERSTALYHGRLNTLADGRSLITFDSGHREYPRNALCCGELLRAFGHALQIEVADCGITLHVQLGLSEGPSSAGMSLGDLLLSDSAQTALNLSQHSRNLLLLSNDLAQHASIIACSRLRPVPQPADASCLESLLNPYPALLQEQLQSF